MARMSECWWLAVRKIDIMFRNCRPMLLQSGRCGLRYDDPPRAGYHQLSLARG